MYGPKSGSAHAAPSTGLAIIGLAVAYFVAGRLGLLLAIPPGYATAVWPASGIALAGLLLLGDRAAAGVFLGSFAVNLTTALSSGPRAASSASMLVLLPACIAVGASLQALLGARLIRRHVGYPTRLDREADIGAFLLLGGPASCLIGASVGTLSLCAFGAIGWDALPFSWFTWWVGDSIGVVVLVPLLLAWLGAPAEVWRARRVWLTLPMVVTFGAAVALFVHASASENARTLQGFRQRADAMATDLGSDVDEHVQALYSLADLRDSVGGLDQAHFHSFVAGALARHPALSAMSWDPVVPTAERDAFEAARRGEGLPGFQIVERGPDGKLVRAGARARYVPIAYSESRQNISLLGFDVASEPLRSEALERARASGRPAMTARVQLANQPGAGLALYVPVVRQGQLEGYVAGIFDPNDLVASVLGNVRAEHIAVSLLDESAPPAQRLLFSTDEPREAAGALAPSVHGDSRFDIAGRTWRLRCTATPEFLVLHRSWQSWYVLAGSLFFTALLGAFLLVLTGRSARVELLVAERLAESENRFRVLLDAAPDAIIIVHKEGHIALVNAQAESLFGYAREELVGQSLARLVPEIIPGGELRGVRKDGSELPIEITLSPIDTPEGPVGIASIRDLTDRLRLEDLRHKSLELEEQNRRIREASRLKNEFLANMSHELRTPLNGIIGFAELMHDGKVGAVSDSHKEYLGDILTSSYHLLQLISDVLDLAKVEAGRMELRLEQVDLPALAREVTDVLRGVAAKNRVVIRTHIDGQLRDVRTDASKVKQILYNYLSNAIKFTDRGGSIDVTVAREDGERFRLAVEDTGIGVRAEDVSKLFSEFQQLDAGTAKRYGGTGLGLALTKRFAEALGGEVGVRTEMGKGSVFFVVLPVESQAPEVQHGR